MTIFEMCKEMWDELTWVGRITVLPWLYPLSLVILGGIAVVVYPLYLLNERGWLPDIGKGIYYIKRIFIKNPS